MKARGINTVMGVSNISFGLPGRDAVNSTFFSMAMAAGLSCGIINPQSKPMMDAITVIVRWQAMTRVARNTCSIMQMHRRLQQQQ